MVSTYRPIPYRPGAICWVYFSTGDGPNPIPQDISLYKTL
jgi:hypothetical protein